MEDRERKVNESAGFYTSRMFGIDYMQAEFAYRSIKPFFIGSPGLELGPASGYMTKKLVNDFSVLHLVEGSASLYSIIPEYPNVVMHCSMFEEFETSMKFQTIIMSHVLEHIEKPVDLMKKIKQWLAPTGVFIVVVPNAKSIHRIVAEKMGLLKSLYELNERDHALGHYRVYDPGTLENDILASGFSIQHRGGSFLKPLSNAQIEATWSLEMMEGFYEAGKEFPGNCAEIFVVAGH